MHSEEKVNEVIEVRKHLVLSGLATGLKDGQLWSLAAVIAQSNGPLIVDKLEEIRLEIFHMGTALDAFVKIYQKAWKEKKLLDQIMYRGL